MAQPSHALVPGTANEVGFYDITAERTDPLRFVVASFLARYKGSTLYDYCHDLELFFTWCANNHLPVLEAKRGHLELYLRHLERRALAESTISRRFGTVACLYKYARRDKVIIDDPAEWIDRPEVRLESQRRTFMTPLEFGKWMAQARETGHVEYALGALLGLRGLRIAEACRLNVDPAALAAGRDHQVALISLPPSVGEAVKATIADRTEGPILLNRWGQRMTRSNATLLIRAVCEAARINKDVSPHSLRRTFVTTSIAIGVPLRDVQLAAGHRHSTTTERYDMGHTSPDSDAAHRLASYVAGIAV
jgi:site-specific recombinase XerD